MKAIRRHGESFLSRTVLRLPERIMFALPDLRPTFRPDVMKAVISKHAFAYSIALVVFLCAINAVLAQPRKSLTLNETAFAFATQLIKKEHFVGDGRGAWSEHRPSPDEENDFIRLHGFDEYAKWHLGIDGRFSEKTKRRYKFPYGDFKNVHRCGLLAAKSRAAEYRHHDIEHAAAQLIEMVSSKRE
jgi:hypothetical protein